MLKYFCAQLGAFFLFASVHVAVAVPYSLQFTATGFLCCDAPEDPVSGSLVFEKSASDFSIDALTSIDLTIDGYTYGLSEVGYSNTSSVVYVGGIVSGVDFVDGGTTDFGLCWDRATGSPACFSYATELTDRHTSPNTGLIDLSFAPRDSASAPLPAALPLFATGLGALGLLGWRRKKKSARARISQID